MVYFPYKRAFSPEISERNVVMPVKMPFPLLHPRNFIRFLSAFSLSFGLLATSPASATILNQDTQHVDLASSVQVYRDPSGKQTLSEITSSSKAPAFRALNLRTGQEANFGFSTDTYWIKFTLQRTEAAGKHWVLEIPYLSLNSITFYAPGQPPVQVGTEFSANLKPLFYPLYALPLEVTQVPQTYYLQVRSDYAVTLPLSLWSRNAFSHEFSNKLLLQALYFGGLLSLAIYNLLLFFSLRERSYFVYTCFSLAMALGMFAGNGYGRLYLWPESPAWDNIAQTTCFGVTGALSLLFATSFLRTKKVAPRTHQLLRLLITAYLVSTGILLASLWTNIPASLGFELILWTTIPGTLGMLFAGIYALRSGNSSALYFLLACSTLWIGATAAALRAFDLIPTNSLTLYALQIGSCLEMLLLSFALAHRINNERAQRIAAQETSISLNAQLLELSQNNEAVLARKVSDRTQHLQRLALSEKNLREQYVRFGAMISHEFRNPLGIIETQATLIQREQQFGINRSEERSETILSATHRLTRLFDQWIKSDQLQQPINEPMLQRVPLKTILDPVLLTARGMHRERVINVGSIPIVTITADLALIEIALLNLIDNAIKYSPEYEPVAIDFADKDDYLGIVVTDKGEGMRAKESASILTPYIRTAGSMNKPGYGLGLAFVSYIAELHNGSIEVKSQPGLGSQFYLWLPLFD